MVGAFPITATCMNIKHSFMDTCLQSENMCVCDFVSWERPFRYRKQNIHNEINEVYEDTLMPCTD